jgi:hypothetical protein
LLHRIRSSDYLQVHVRFNQIIKSLGAHLAMFVAHLVLWALLIHFVFPQPRMIPKNRYELGPLNEWTTHSSLPTQLIRNRELAAIAFPHNNAPAYGLAMMESKYCGKWDVSIFPSSVDYFLTCTDSGAIGSLERMEGRPNEQSSHIHEIRQVNRHDVPPAEEGRYVPCHIICPAAMLTYLRIRLPSVGWKH